MPVSVFASGMRKRAPSGSCRRTWLADTYAGASQDLADGATPHVAAAYPGASLTQVIGDGGLGDPELFGYVPRTVTRAQLPRKAWTAPLKLERHLLSRPATPTPPRTTRRRPPISAPDPLWRYRLHDLKAEQAPSCASELPARPKPKQPNQASLQTSVGAVCLWRGRGKLTEALWPAQDPSKSCRASGSRSPTRARHSGRPGP
jgi:hypothetical protein